jgi:polyhydroxyalkanoate synthase
MTWNADATRMPARMHSEYLRRFFLHNDLVEGRFEARGRPVALTDIQAPMFLVGTETDHVAPWRSVYKAHLFTRSAITFVLASGGHNAGVVSEPGHTRRHYNIRTHEPDAAFIGPDDWLGLAERRDGSWWLAWRDWLDKQSGDMAEPPPMGGTYAASLGPAPGTYVLQR